jgi:endonuclease YncB( thermonuclease family)
MPQRALYPAALAAAILAAILAPLLEPRALAADEVYHGQVVSVQDGDTITVTTTDYEQLRVRLYGIDCPERGQDYGPQAKEYMEGLVSGKTVELLVVDIDRYSRYVALVGLDGALVNELMARAGFAWTYEQYCKAAGPCGMIREAESDARARKAGLWADPAPVPPWDYRSSRRRR